MIKFFKYIFSFSFLLFFTFSCESGQKYDVLFSYRSIIDKEYRFNVGRVIPVTISQSIETDGDLSGDGNFFFYTSNREGGNYDIYLRSMNDITTVRLTSHPSKELSPVISPDGKTLAFVSYRTDPEGDIFTLKLNPADLIKNAGESIKGPESLDNEAVNISLQKSKYGVVMNRKDSSPVWSPDGKRIAFSTIVKNRAEIWTMTADGKDKKAVTSKGGDYPSFSEDGNRILFISYRDNKQGDIYSIDLTSGTETRLSNSSGIKLYPSYAGSTDKIIYSSIEKDTNRNGRLDLQDRSVLKMMNLSDKTSYSLTSSELSSFKAKWLPVLKTRDYNGVIVYTDITGQNINLNIIPEKGIIPAKRNAKQQYDLCEKYIEEYDDPERYSMALEAVYYNFGRKKDQSSVVYVDRALRDAALYFKKNSSITKSREMTSILASRAGSNDAYALSVLNMLKKSGLNTPPVKKSKTARKNNEKYFAPFILEDQGDVLFNAGKMKQASKIYSAVMKKYSAFERAMDIKTKYALCSDSLLNIRLSDSAKEIITKGRTNQKIALTKGLIAPFLKKKFNRSDSNKIYSNIKKLKAANTGSKKIMALLHFTEGTVQYQSGDEVKAQTELMKAVRLSHPNDLIYYMANIRLGEMERKNRNLVAAENFFHTGINRYSRRFKTEQFKEKIIWLIEYYEKTGETKEIAGKYKEAAGTYKKYVDLITLMYNKKLYSEIYGKYAPRAHVLYINAYAGWKGARGITELEESYNKKLPVYRMDFNKAAIYGLAYIYTLKAENFYSSLSDENRYTGFSEIIENFKKADEQIEWALFIDDTFIEPYLLKSWIYQFIDLERKNSKGEHDSVIAEFFPGQLWEKNIAVLEKALNANDEKEYPENEGNINLNMANNYYLLYNYPRALKHYREAEKYKNKFSTGIERALFHFHLGYAYWQNDDTASAREEIKKAHNIYKNIPGQEAGRYSGQFLIFYKYYALFSRYENKYDEAIEWYKKILEFAELKKLPLDRARYVQEIAYCYKKLGQLDLAKAYISRAGMLLKKYPEDERKYNLNIKLFGIGPFPIFNMGPDTAVIGDNRIFHPLDRESKKLLNISMLEDISLLNNDYGKAIKFQKKKISLLKESGTSLSLETRIRSTNNIGFYYFQSGKFAEAEKYFKKARKLSEEKGNLQGMFTSIMNITNLYALMIENDMDSSRDWKKETASLIKGIEDYRNGYAEARLADATESLREEAKLKKRKVTARELKELKLDVEKATSEVYYSLDIALGIIKFHRAEILYKTQFSTGKDIIQSSMDRLNKNSSIFSDYSDALSRFLRAYQVAEEKGNKYLMTKLLLNSATCYEKTGEREKAYVSLLDAGDMADKYRYRWLKAEASYRTGDFLQRYGEEFEGTGYMARAENFFKSAAELIEENPLIFRSRMQRIDAFYKSYTSLLIKQKKFTDALTISERGAGIKRMMLINNISPEFRNDFDRADYYSCLSEIEEEKSVNLSISLLLEGGAAADSDKIISLTKKRKELSDSLKQKIQVLINKKSIIASYVKMNRSKMPASSNPIFKFFKTETGTVCWSIEKREVKTRFFPRGSDDVKDISRFISSSKTDQPVFIIINSTALELMKTSEWKPERECMLITGLDRTEEYTGNKNPILPSVYSEVGNFKNISEDLSLSITENAEGRDMRDYSLIIDKKGEGTDITPSLLFARRGLSPSALISIGDDLSADYITGMTEAALYAGTKSLVFSSSDNGDLTADLLRKIYTGKSEPADSKILAAGYINTFKPAGSAKTSEEELAGFKAAMISSDYDKARLHLSRWNTVQHDKNGIEYIKNMWLIELLGGDISRANRRAESFSPRTPVEVSTRKLMQTVIFLSTGKFNEASELVKTIEIDQTKYSDIDFINVLLTFSKTGVKDAVTQLKLIKRPSKTIIPEERYIMLLSQYISAFDTGAGSEIFKMAGEKAFLSPGEHLLMLMMAGKKTPEKISFRFDNIKSLWTLSGSASDLRDGASRTITGSEGYDRLSILPVIFLAARYDVSNETDELGTFLSSISLDEIAGASDTASSLFLLNYADSQLQQNGDYDQSEKLHNIIEKIVKESSSPFLKRHFLYKKALNLTLLSRYEEAFASASEAEPMMEKDDSGYIELQLLLMNLYIKSDRFDQAAVRGENIRTSSGLKPYQYYMLNLQKSMIELNRLSRLKSASAADAAQFEKLFIKSINLLKSDIKILGHQGFSEITEQIFDEFINYKFRTGQHQDAHYFNELKKLALISSATGRNFISNSGVIDTSALQQSLPADALYLNISKNKKSLFVWALSRKRRTAFVIDDAYAGAVAVNSGLKDGGSSPSDYLSAGKKLDKVLSKITAVMKNKSSVILCTDSYTEKIRFELMQQAEQASLFYIVSPLIPGVLNSPDSSALTLTGRNSSVLSHLEETAAAESGITSKYSAKVSSGTAHILGRVRYNRRNKSFFVNDQPYSSTISRADFIYTNSAEIRDTGINNFFSFNRELGVKAAVINANDIRDVNNAVFVEGFYRELKKSGSLTKAYSSALNSLRNNRKFTSPAYWSGLRMYVNNLNLKNL